MAIHATTFIWEHDPKKKVVETVKAEPKQPVLTTPDYIYLSKDGTLRVKRSQYTEDMMGK